MPREPEDFNVYVDELNERHFIASEGGRVLVITERHDSAMKRLVLDRSTAADFKLFYSNRFVWEQRESPNGDVKNTKIPLGKYWLEHHDRRQYEEIIFNPDPAYKPNPDVYNLWKGLKIKPGPGDWPLWREHLFTIGAAGDVDTYNFLLDWLARLLQYPHLPGETAIVWRGRPGTGKGTIAREMGKVVGQHFVHVHNVKHLVGNFNAHLRDALLVFSDEALWAGDKASEGILKAMVTEPTLLLEPKGRDVFSVPNRIHLVMATNSEWAAPVGVDDRRFCVIDVPDYHIDDQPYFDRLYAALAAGEMAAFVAFLMERDVRQAPKLPKSAAALESSLTQKLFTMPPAWQWFYERLEAGQLLSKEAGWPTEVSRADLHADYIAYAELVNVNHRSSETILGMTLRKMLPPGTRVVRRQTALFDGARGRAWVMPPLDECRSHFADQLKMPHLFKASIEQERERDNT